MTLFYFSNSLLNVLSKISDLQDIMDLLSEWHWSYVCLFLCVLQANAVSCPLHFAVLGFCLGQDVDVFVLGNILIFLFLAKFYCFGLNFNVFSFDFGSFGLYFNWGFDSELEVFVTLFGIKLSQVEIQSSVVSVFLSIVFCSTNQTLILLSHCSFIYFYYNNTCRQVLQVTHTLHNEHWIPHSFWMVMRCV